jgi:hypothetical protein
MFFKGSRYASVVTAEMTDERGRVLHYKRVRFIPEARAGLGHIVGEGERLDHIADRYYHDAEQFWRICDANRALWPHDLTRQPRRILAIPTAEG